jgi:hypothetical protein
MSSTVGQWCDAKLAELASEWGRLEFERREIVRRQSEIERDVERLRAAHSIAAPAVIPKEVG